MLFFAFILIGFLAIGAGSGSGTVISSLLVILVGGGINVPLANKPQSQPQPPSQPPDSTANKQKTQ